VFLLLWFEKEPAWRQTGKGWTDPDSYRDGLKRIFLCCLWQVF